MCFSGRHTQRGETFYLEDDVDVVSQRVQVVEGQFERNCIGVEEGARLHEIQTERLYHLCPHRASGCVYVCAYVCVYLDVDSFDEQCRVQRKSTAAVHCEELLHLLQSLLEDTLNNTHTHTLY